MKPQCIFCEKSDQGYVCSKCSTSGQEYYIKCPSCFGTLRAKILCDYKKDFNPPIFDPDTFLEMKDKICEKCLKEVSVLSPITNNNK